MKTIAISIDETTLKRLDELTGPQPGRRNRSALVRVALRGFVERERKQQIEAQEAEIFRKHRKRLAREARALVARQARP